MDADGGACGPLHALYAAARDGDEAAMQRRWPPAREALEAADGRHLDRLDEAIESGDTGSARRAAAELVFEDAREPEIDGPLARLVNAVLFGFGYLASFVLFFRARTPRAVVRRLRWAYRTVGVEVRDTETVDGVERTVFRCPYRNLGADRWGKRRACHDVLDRVDDGYVRWLASHRGLEYRRPRACSASECCYSEVVEP